MDNSISGVLRSYPWMRMILVIVVAAILGTLRNTLFPGGVSFSANAASDRAIADTLSETISLETGYRLHQQGVQFLDARTGENYQSGHISGALNIPVDASFHKKVQLTESLDPNRRYVIYCNDPACPLGDELYEFLKIAGFTRLHIMEAGYDGWNAAGYPVAQGGGTDAG